MTTPTPDANDILMGVAGPPAFKFEAPGDTVGGRITSRPQAFQEREYEKDKPGTGDLKFFPSGDPIMGILVDVATNLRSGPDDDGARRIYVQGQRLKKAIRDAVINSGGAGLEVGGELTVTFTHREDPEDKRSAKYYTATYVPAAQAALQPDPTPSAPAQQPTATQLAAAPVAAAAPLQQPAAQILSPVPAQPAPVAAPIDQAALQAAMANLSPEVLAAIAASQQPPVTS